MDLIGSVREVLAAGPGSALLVPAGVALASLLACALVLAAKRPGLLASAGIAGTVLGIAFP